ncbi:MAG: YdcF family protein [Egibacteraceae bacterium]
MARIRARGRQRRLLPRAFGWAMAAVPLYLCVTFLQVAVAALRDEAREVQAIVVLGAAQYDGRPSPVFQSRLDHAAALYEQGLAPIVVVTGGGRPGDRYSEARAAAEYLYTRGVPDDAQRREVDGRSSWESLSATARFLSDEGIDQVLLVSDPWHSYRIESIAKGEGLDAYTSPTPTSPYTAGGTVRRLVREAGAVALGRVIGYRRLEHVQDRMVWSR